MLKHYTWRLLHPTAEGGAAAADPEKDQAAAAEDGGAKDEGGADEDAEGDGEEGEGADDTVTMSKADYEAALKKAEKRGARDARKTAAPAASEEGGEDDPAKAAEAKLQAATEKMLAATVKSVASDMDITANGLKVAGRLLDTSECVDENGEVDEDAVKDALEDFLADYPEFKKTAEKKPGFQAQGNPKATKTTAEDAKKAALGIK